MGLGSSLKKVAKKVRSAASKTVSTVKNVASSTWNKTLNTYDDVTNELGSNSIVRTIYKPLSYPLVKSFESYQRLADTTLLSIRARSPTKLFRDVSVLRLSTFIPERITVVNWKPPITVPKNRADITNINLKELNSEEILLNHKCMPSLAAEPIRRYIMVKYTQGQVNNEYVTWKTRTYTTTGTNILGETYTIHHYYIDYVLRPYFVKLGLKIACDANIYEGEINFEVGQTTIAVACNSSYIWNSLLVCDAKTGEIALNDDGIWETAAPTLKIFNDIF